MKARYSLFALAAVAALLLGGCVPSAITPAAPAPAGPKPFITWYQYDQDNEDPASDERVGNAYLRKAIPLFNQAFAGKWVWENHFVPWDKGIAQIIAAVQAKGEVPDLMEIGSAFVYDLYKNGTMQDLRPWAETQPWWADIDPGSLFTCTGPDGKLYCIPVVARPHLVFVWKDRFPDGFPTTPEQFLAEGERLKAQGLYAMSFFGSTANDGDGASRAVWMIFASFGGTYDDGQGNMLLNTPENVAAVTWLREMVQRGYVPEVAFVGGFQEEEVFKDATAASFPTGLFGYRYINPLTAPSGRRYDTRTEQDMLDAIAAGDIILRPMVAPEGKTPGCNLNTQNLAIPVGAKNVEAAHDYINWIMSPEQYPEYVLGPGAGFPTLRSTQALPQFQAPLYKEAAQAVNASICRPEKGSLQNAGLMKKVVMTAVYKLIKEDPTADIAAELQKAQDEYNRLK